METANKVQQDDCVSLYEVIYDYVAKEDDELTLVKGSSIQVISKDYQVSGDEGWWLGCYNGKTGVFPLDYVIKIKDNWNKNHIPVLKFSDIEIKECIGSGGFGKVCRAFHKGVEVAIKEAHIDDQDIETLKETVIREANICWMFKHPNIIKLKGVCLDQPHFCLIMEYAKGGSLGRLLNARKFVLPPFILIKWALQVAYGMHYLHEQAKIIHRDLKSGNILLNEEVRNSNYDDLSKIILKLTDFGLAREFQCTANMTNCGTYSWMSPEVIKSSSFSKASDVWSFGVLLWELLTNEVPYKGMDPHRVQYGVAMNKLQLPIPKSCPQIFSDLIQSCWDIDPHKRLTFKEIIEKLIEISNSPFASTESESFQMLQEDWKSEIYLKFKEKEEQIRNREEELERIESKNREMREILMQKQRELDEREKDLVARELTLVLKQINPPEPKKRRNFFYKGPFNFLRSSHTKPIDISTPSGFHHCVAVKTDIKSPFDNQNLSTSIPSVTPLGNASPNLRYRVILTDRDNTETKQHKKHSATFLNKRDKSSDQISTTESKASNHISRKAKPPKSTTIWYHNDYLRSNSLDCNVSLVDNRSSMQSSQQNSKLNDGGFFNSSSASTTISSNNPSTKRISSAILEIGGLLSVFAIGKNIKEAKVESSTPRLKHKANTIVSKSQPVQQQQPQQQHELLETAQNFSASRLHKTYPYRFKMSDSDRLQKQQKTDLSDSNLQQNTQTPSSIESSYDNYSAKSVLSYLPFVAQQPELILPKGDVSNDDSTKTTNTTLSSTKTTNINRPMTLNLMLKNEIEKSSYFNKQKRKDLLTSSNEDEELTILNIDKQMKSLLKKQHRDDQIKQKKLNNLNTPLLMLPTSLHQNVITPISSEDLCYTTNDFLIHNNTNTVSLTPNNTPPSRDMMNQSFKSKINDSSNSAISGIDDYDNDVLIDSFCSDTNEQYEHL